MVKLKTYTSILTVVLDLSRSADLSVLAVCSTYKLVINPIIDYRNFAELFYAESVTWCYVF